MNRREALGCLAILSSGTQQLRAAPPPVNETRDASIGFLKATIRTLSPAFDDFTPTDWSRRNPDEKAQSLEAYVASRPNQPTATRKTLYIQPIGSLPKPYAEALKATQEVLSLYFGTAVKLLPEFDAARIPQSGRRIHPDWEVPQLLTSYLLNDVLKPVRPADAVAVLGITASDLWPGRDWNFVFGQASLSERVGVWSLHRFGDPTKDETSRKLFLLRTLKVATHETGHMFGIRHCVHFRCGMNGSNSLSETDDAPLAFCPECVAKLCWATQTQPTAWFRKALKFGEQYQLNDASVWSDCVALTKGA